MFGCWVLDHRLTVDVVLLVVVVVVLLLLLLLLLLVLLPPRISPRASALGDEWVCQTHSQASQHAGPPACPVSSASQPCWSALPASPANSEGGR